jgi:hypothetical protein
MKLSTFLFTFIAASVFIGLFQRTNPDGSPSQSTENAPVSSGPSTGDRAVISGDNWFGAQSKEVFQKLVDLSIAKDGEAFGKLMTAGLLTGKTTAFEQGEEVFVADISYFSGTAKVRRKGDVAEFWTNIEAVEKPRLKAKAPTAPIIEGWTFTEVESTYGKALSADKATGWATWPQFRARFEKGNVVESEPLTP